MRPTEEIQAEYGSLCAQLGQHEYQKSVLLRRMAEIDAEAKQNHVQQAQVANIAKPKRGAKSNGSTKTKSK